MEFHLTTADAWAVMTEACEKAEVSIDFEQYIVKADAVGHDFLRLLARKAREGLHVRIILDAFGSRAVGKTPVIAELEGAGAQIVFYHRLRPAELFKPLSWLPRTHAKLLHVDGTATYLGSMCLAEYMRSWRDTMVRLEDGLAEAARHDFETMWHDLEDGRLDGDGEETVVRQMDACYVSQNPRGGHFPLYNAFVSAIDGAKHEICIATPYFFPPKRLREALSRALARGVRVVLLLSHETDVPIADRVTRALLPSWRAKGFEVLLYQRSVLHAKYAIVDGEWATLGSCNFDYLSLCRNREANIILRDPAMVAEVARSFADDAVFARPPKREDERARSWFDGLMGRFGTMVLRRL
jgi:cardiolipin synthase A/B